MAVGKGGGGYQVRWLWQGLGPGLGSHVATHEEEEVENEEEVLDEAEAAVLGRHLRLEGWAARGEGPNRRGVSSGGEGQKEAVREGEGERKNTRKRKFQRWSPAPSLYTLEVAFLSIWAPRRPHLPHSDTHQYLRGLGICGHQGHVG